MKLLSGGILWTNELWFLLYISYLNHEEELHLQEKKKVFVYNGIIKNINRKKGSIANK